MVWPRVQPGSKTVVTGLPSAPVMPGTEPSGSVNSCATTRRHAISIASAQRRTLANWPVGSTSSTESGRQKSAVAPVDAAPRTSAPAMPATVARSPPTTPAVAEVPLPLPGDWSESERLPSGATKGT